LRCFINRVFNNDRGRRLRLRFMPCVHLMVNGRYGFGLINELPRLSVSRFGIDQRYKNARP
jgi:hypothetical protein